MGTTGLGGGGWLLVAGALEDAGSWDRVWATTVVGSRSRVDVEGDARVVRGVRAREADGISGGSRSTTSDVDLGASNVDLSTASTVSRVESDEFSSEEVVARSEARRHLEVMPASLLDHGIDTPFSTVQTLLSNLKPAETRGTGACRVVDLGHVEHGGTLVAGGDRMVRVVLSLRAANDVTPPSTDTSTSRNVDNGVVLILNVVVAGHSAVVHIGDGVVAAGGTNTLKLALILAINRHFLEDGVAIGDRCEREESQSRELHAS